MRRSKPVLIALALALSAPIVGHAQSSDPAARQVDALDSALLAAMKSGKSASPTERAHRLASTADRVFDFPRMIRFASGAAWARMTPAQQSALTAAFARYSVANLAHNFSSYGGESFVLDHVDTRLPDKLVWTKLQKASGAPVVLTYRIQQDGGEWRIIDVYFTGSISELAQQSSDFGATLASGGAPALTQKLDAQAAALLR